MELHDYFLRVMGSESDNLDEDDDLEEDEDEDEEDDEDYDSGDVEDDE